MSTCDFADRVAALTLTEYRSRTGEHGKGWSGQSVLASFVVQRADGGVEQSLAAVALGSGTKFMPALAAQTDLIRRCIRDSHAEVIARRSFLRYLQAQIEQCADGGAESAESIFQRSAAGKCELKAGVTFHLYTSSAPCGNACISKWTKGARTQGVSLLPFEYPTAHIVSPDEVTFQAQAEGQISVLAKGSGHSSGQEDAGDVADGRRAVPPGCSRIAKLEDVVGTDGASLTCSDKIARWNALGVQGALLMCFLERPLYLSTVTVGRKFDLLRCQRALCCRLQHFRPATCAALEGTDFRIHHVAVMGTHMKLDQGTISTSGVDQGARFGDRCVAWTIGDARASEHDGLTGKSLDDQSETVISTAALFASFVKTVERSVAGRSWLRVPAALDRGCTLAEAKVACTAYAKAHAVLMSPASAGGLRA